MAKVLEILDCKNNKEFIVLFVKFLLENDVYLNYLVNLDMDFCPILPKEPDRFISRAFSLRESNEGFGYWGKLNGKWLYKLKYYLIKNKLK